MHFGHSCSCCQSLVNPPGAKFSCFVLSEQQQKPSGASRLNHACNWLVGFWDEHLKGLGYSKGQCQPSHPLCPSTAVGTNCTVALGCLLKHRCTCEGLMLSSVHQLFARNVLVTAPAVMIAYKWCKMGSRQGHQPPQVPLPRPTGSPSRGCSVDVCIMNFHGFSEAVARS